MLVACGQMVIELTDKIKELVLSEGEVLPNGLQHGVHNQLNRVGEGHISQFIHHHQEQLADGPVILVAALLQREQHVSDENQRYMGAECVVGQGMAF